jgi:predicted porin
MKKLLIAASVAAALAPVLAHADVTIYGSMRGGISDIKNASTGFQSVTGVDDFNSRLGFKGTEDLGNGLKAVWQVESGVRVDGVNSKSGSGTGTLGNRDTFVGLAGDFGSIRIGQIDDVLTETEATDNLYGPKRDSVGANFPLYEGSDLIGTYGDGFAKNAIRWDSPTWNGFNAIAIYSAGEAANHVGDNYGLRLAYRNDPTGLFAAYAYMGVNKQVGDHDGKTQRIEFGYDANNLYVAGTYQWINVYGDARPSIGGVPTSLPGSTVNDAAANLKNESWAINVAYTMGNWKPNFVYSVRKNPTVDGTTQDWGAKQWALGVDYTVSKHTMLEAGYGEVKNNQGAATALGQTDTKSNVTYLMLKTNF